MTDSSFDKQLWAGRDSEIALRVLDQSKRCLDAYRVNPLLVEEHANIERATAQGGYGRRQIYELIQNGADELLQEPGGMVHVLLTEDALYCANQGTPITPRGVDAILSAQLSVKRGDEIGRFGMGFKSVLGVTDMPDFFSRSGSFRFDCEWSEGKVREILPDAERTPVLRTAYPLDPARASASDPTLRALMSWATTVVRLPIQRNASPWLVEQIRQFPAEFLLFSPHVGKLVLEDRVENVRRTIELAKHDGRYLLTVEGGTSSWMVFKTVHRPSEQARREAGELADREFIPIIWAVPTEGRRRLARGQFWAFFPTHYETTLSGILNAPWKTNEDRQNLLEGPFNEEILGIAAQMIAEHLPELSSPEDPGAHLDLMPARGKEAPNWADDLLTRAVYKLAAAQPSLPDQKGRLRLPSEIRCHPAGVPSDALEEWSSYSDGPIDWCHRAVETRERRPRVERLLSEVENSAATAGAWLESLAADLTPEASAAALRTAGRVLSADANQRAAILAAKIALSTTGELSCPDPNRLSLPGEYVSSGEELMTIHPVVVDDPAAKAFLLELGLREADPLQEVRGIVASGNDSLDSDEWVSFWRLIRIAGHDAAAPVLVSATQFRVHAKAMDGNFRPIDQLLFPGPIVSEDGSADRAVGVDTSFHSADLRLLQMIGIVPSPRFGGGSTREPWFGRYTMDCRETFLRAIDRHPPDHNLVFDSKDFVGPLVPLFGLEEEGRARFTEAALAADPDAEPWTMFHRTRRQDYPQIDMRDPLQWVLRREGRLHSSLGIKKPEEAVGPQLSEWAEFLPVATIPQAHAALLNLPSSLDELEARHWREAIRLAQGVIDDRLRGRFYGVAAGHRNRPGHILSRVGRSHQLEEPSNVTAVTDDREMFALAERGMPVLLCASSDLPALVDRWGLISGESKVRTTVERVEAASATPITDRWPLLASTLTNEQQALELVPCEALRLVTITADARSPEDIVFHRTDGHILYAADLEEHEILRRIADEFDLELDAHDIQRIIEQRVEDQRRETTDEIAALEDPAERLLRLVGPEAIGRLLTPSLVEGAERILGPVDDAMSARLALASHGVNTLKVLRDEMTEWTPPTQWAGSRRAREFVTSIGFGVEYAGFQTAQRDPLVTVDGPLTLPPLHDFQSQISAELRKILRGEIGTRGLISLPTGAGKTRVAVQTVIDAAKKAEILGPVLWVAQSDELCEQAVQAWTEVWRSVGPESRMYVSRLWGSNEVAAVGSGLQVVVATIDKLRARHGRPDYEWLWEADCIIIDEAHQSITPEYTRLLKTFGMGRGTERVPLIGLTATPFRGENERETQILASRYGNRLLDEGVLGENPYRALQTMGVLAEVDHEILPGSEVQLSEEERQLLEDFGRMPGSVEGRLGSDSDRNEVLLNSIQALPKDWTVLLFATSVDHARVMAALLTMVDIPAAAISGETEAGARRHYVEEFRRGSIRVLTNYGVLTQGFDAPAVRAVYVARPTFSPNLYQQMIGRGLRGPLNGGEPTCRIVNVADNFLLFGEQLAFHKFDYLWNKAK